MTLYHRSIELFIITKHFVKLPRLLTGSASVSKLHHCLIMMLRRWLVRASAEDYFHIFLKRALSDAEGTVYRLHFSCVIIGSHWHIAILEKKKQAVI